MYKVVTLLDLNVDKPEHRVEKRILYICAKAEAQYHYLEIYLQANDI